MTPIDVATLFVVESAAKIYSTWLGIAQTVGLPVTTWRAGDPTRTLGKFAARILGEFELTASDYIKAGFRSSATGAWMKLHAQDVYGVEPPEASYATPTVTVDNEGDGQYGYDPGDFVFRSSSNGKTYHNTNAVSIAAGETGVLFELIADEAGSDSSVGLDEIDEKVTSAAELTIVSSTASLASDDATDEEIDVLCETSLGSLSLASPADGYEFVALNSELTGTSGINRARAVGSTTGAVTVYVAGPDGAVDGSAVALVQDAVERWATCLTANPTVVSAEELAIDVTMTVTKAAALTGTNAENQDVIESAILALFARNPIGGDGFVRIAPVIHEVFAAFEQGMIVNVQSVTLNGSLGDIVLDPDQVPALASITVAFA